MTPFVLQIVCHAGFPNIDQNGININDVRAKKTHFAPEGHCPISGAPKLLALSAPIFFFKIVHEKLPHRAYDTVQTG